jgi:hypothetical protein
MEPDQEKLAVAHYESPECVADLTVDRDNQTVWATQQQIADLFGVGRTAIGKHLKKIYDSKELEPEATSAKMALVRIEGGREVSRDVDHYNLDVILAVGYRVASQKASDFRRWATEVLREYIVEGFALNERRLRDDEAALKNLAARVRKLRADEKNIYAGVRDVFAFGATDYDPGSKAAKSFFAMIQDKFLFAITGQPAQQILLDRANHKLHNMGLQTMKGEKPQFEDAQISKNYLNSDELYGLHILCEQFLLFVESRALRGQPLTMLEMAKKFDDLLIVQGHPVMREYGSYLVQKAKSHACRELDLYRKRMDDERRLAS